MKKLNFLPIILLLFIVLISCDESTVTEPPKKSNKNEIVPLSVGNYWKYKITDYDTINPQIDFAEERITNDTTIDNVKYFVLEKLFSKNKSFCYNDTNGYFQNSKDYNVFIKYPAQVGEVFYMNPFSDTVKVISVNQKITVPAGTFECYHYQSYDNISRTDENGLVLKRYLVKVDFYYSVGVGMVLINYTNVENNRSNIMFKQELIEYNVE